MELPTKLDGAVSIYIFKVKTNAVERLILLIGDRHSLPKYTCEEKAGKLDDFLEQTFKNSKNCIDFFIEAQFLEKKGIPFFPSTPGLMSDLIRKYHRCLKHMKGSCEEIGNVRMHYTDLRVVNIKGIDKEHISYFLFPMVFTEIRRVLKDPFDKVALNKLINALDEDRIIENLRYILGYGDKPKDFGKYPMVFRKIMNIQRERTSKQLQSLPIALRKKIKTHIDEIMLDDVIKPYEEMKTCTAEESVEICNIIVWDFMFLCNRTLVDIYLLARLLKPTLSDSNIAIVYMGGIHCETYAKFFKKEKFSELIWEKALKRKEMDKCITIPQKVIDKVLEITKAFPSNKCFTTTSVKEIQNKYGKHRKVC